MEADGIRYGFATSTFTVRTTATATPMVTIQSRATAARWGSRRVSLLSGLGIPQEGSRRALYAGSCTEEPLPRPSSCSWSCPT